MISAQKAEFDTGLPTASSLIEAVAGGSLTASRLVDQCLARIDGAEGEIRAFVELDADGAKSAAAAADAIPDSERGPLHGLPVAVKEVFDVAGLHCGWGSPIHRDRVPDEDCEVVRRLRAAGAIIVGTAVSTEYAIAAAGPTVNPHNHSRTPGGSSSGPAAAVAAGMVPVAIGSQTVGSIVRPAAYCGVFGLKPTRGAISGRAAMPLSPRLDHPGFFTRSAGDLSLLCQVLFGRDEQDVHSLEVAPPSALPDISSIRVMVTDRIPPDPVSKESVNAVDAAALRLRRAGAQTEPFTFPEAYDRVFDVLHAIMTHDMAQAHGQDRDRHGERMSDRLRGLIDHGRTVTQAQYDDAVETAERWRAELSDKLGEDSVILAPATDTVAPPLTEGTGSNRPQALWSLVGLPVASIPCAVHEGLPLGAQVAAGPGREDCVIAVADSLEQD